jgi:branched-subunit amino acid aminotransferase/4-amino-4-deoxychorismate lyase
LRLRTVRNPVSKNQPYLMLKTFQYATRLRIAQEANADGYDTALLLDDQENLQEAAQANVFLKLKSGWATPTADGGLLPGIVRHALLDAQPVPIVERSISAKELGDVTEAFVTNSNLGIIPVTQIDGFDLPVGPDTSKLIKWLEPPMSPATKYLFINKAMPMR